MRDLLPDIHNISCEISHRQKEKADVESNISRLNSQISELKTRKEEIDNKIAELTSRKYVFGRKQYRNPDVRESLVRDGEASGDHRLMELAFIIEEKDASQEKLTNEMIDYLIILDQGVREKNKNANSLVAELSKGKEPFGKEFGNDN